MNESKKKIQRCGNSVYTTTHTQLKKKNCDRTLGEVAEYFTSDIFFCSKSDVFNEYAE